MRFSKAKPKQTTHDLYDQYSVYNVSVVFIFRLKVLIESFNLLTDEYNAMIEVEQFVEESLLTWSVHG